MPQRRAAIISKNKIISRLVESELRLLDYAVDTFDAYEGRLDGYFAIISDCTDTFSQPHGDAKIKLAIVREQNSFDVGAFAYHLSFPFPLERLRSILNSVPEEKKSEDPAQKTLKLDEKALTAHLFDVTVSLSGHEFKILRALCENSGECVSRTDLTELLGANDSNIADVYICHLRKKLEEPFGIKIIYSIRGKGYMTNYQLK